MVFNLQVVLYAAGLLGLSAVVVVAPLYFNLFIHPIGHYPESLSWQVVLNTAGLLGLAGVLVAARICYNLFLHPLRHYPGPLSCRATFLKWMIVQCSGESKNYIQAQHAKYGTIVRIEPNMLSFADPLAYYDIYGHRTKQAQPGLPPSGYLPKSNFARRDSANGYFDIVNAPTNEDHRRQKRLMNHMFSASALSGQHPLINRYVDKLISQIRAYGANGKPIDLSMWYNYTTFDILGALNFRDDFGCLSSGELHPWVANIFGSLKDSFLQRNLNRFPWPLNKMVYAFVVDRTLTNARRNEFDFASHKARKRIEQGIMENEHDFTSYMLKHNDEKGMHHKEIEANSSILIIAGSETIASNLSGMTYHLLRNPNVLAKLTNLLRTTFATEQDMTEHALNKLDYLTAVIEEGGRTYPPIPSGLTRETPPGGATLCGKVVPAGTVVSVHPFTTANSPLYFKNPDKFVPERWLGKEAPAEYQDDDLRASMPFSYGPRSCIGQNLAMAEMRLILSKVLWNFDLELTPKSLNWKDGQKIFTVWEKKPLFVKVTPKAG